MPSVRQSFCSKDVTFSHLTFRRCTSSKGILVNPALLTIKTVCLKNDDRQHMVSTTGVTNRGTKNVCPRTKDIENKYTILSTHPGFYEQSIQP